MGAYPRYEIHATGLYKAEQIADLAQRNNHLQRNEPETRRYRARNLKTPIA